MDGGQLQVFDNRCVAHISAALYGSSQEAAVAAAAIRGTRHVERAGRAGARAATAAARRAAAAVPRGAGRARLSALQKSWFLRDASPHRLATSAAKLTLTRVDALLAELYGVPDFAAFAKSEDVSKQQ